MNSPIDNLNYLNDPRTQKPSPKTVSIDGVDVELPTKWEVCSVCDGKGTHVNPSIDAGGISAGQFAEDPDFAEDYFGGVYDQTCNRCNGRTTEQVVDCAAMSEELQEAYENELQELAGYEAECRAEIMMGA